MNLRKQLSSYIALNNYVEAFRENTSSIVLTDAITNGLTDLQLKGSEVKNKPETFLDSVVAKGGTEQNGTPTPDTPMDIVCNNGVLKVRHQSGLPLDYQRVEYLESSGKQIIDLGFKWTYNISTKTDCEMLKKTTIALSCVGARNSGNIVWGNFSNENNINYTCFGNIVNVMFTQNMVDGQFHVWETNHDGFYLDGVQKTNLSGSDPTLTSKDNTCLFGRYNGSGNIERCGKWKIKSHQTYDNNVLVQNLIPCRHKSDNVLGMYDTVTDTFFTNAGTGEFVAGNPVSDPVEIYTDGTVETIKDSLNNTATTEMLLKVGDYQDVQEILSGAVTRNVGVKVLDGTENWTRGQSFYCDTLTGVLQADHSCYCTHYQGIMNTSAVVTDSNTCRVGYHIGSDIAWDRLYIYADRSLYATAQDFANYLADQYAKGTPVIVVYPLNASTTETVSPQKLLKNPVTVTEASIDNLEVTTTEAEHTVPTPDYPLDIMCNNGVLKVGSDNSVIVEGTPETVTITGKNLLDINKTSGAGYLDTSGELVPYDNYYCSDYIEIKPSTVYTYTETMKLADKNNYIRFCFYDSNKTFIPPRQGNTPTTEAKTYTYKITSPLNAKYIRISSHSNFVKGQLEEGIRPTKYEEYYQASFAPEDLLKLSDYQDVQSVLDGIVTRNVVVKVLDGTEYWVRYGTGRFSTPLIGSKKQDNQQAPIGSHFIGKSYPNVPDEDGRMAVFNGSIAQTSGTLGINYQATPEVEQFKQWLADQYAAGTPVIVVYPLANTVEETVESRDVFITSGTNTIERNSEYVSSDSITVKYKKLR